MYIKKPSQIKEQFNIPDELYRDFMAMVEENFDQFTSTSVIPTNKLILVAQSHIKKPVSEDNLKIIVHEFTNYGWYVEVHPTETIFSADEDENEETEETKTTEDRNISLGELFENIFTKDFPKIPHGGYTVNTLPKYFYFRK
jgi:hypothetical protein